MSEDWRILQGYNEFGYTVIDSLWGHIAIWKVRILGAGGTHRGKKTVLYKQVELIWHQEKARTTPYHKYTNAQGVEHIIRVFRGMPENIGRLSEACYKVQGIRDQVRSRELAFRTSRHEEIRRAQEDIAVVTQRIAELDLFVATEVVPGDILEAELQEEDRVLSEMRAEG